LKTLAELARLPDNWDGYGSPPLRPVAIATAVRLLCGLGSYELPAPGIFPVTGGGVGITWQLSNRKLEIETLPDGTLEYFTVDREEGTDKETVREGLLSLDRMGKVRGLIEWLINA
jgi:hypothetical protein